MTTSRYILDADHQPRQVTDLMEWAKWVETADRKVALTKTVYLSQEVRVSTVFLGIDHQFGQGPPLLFETMVFGGSDEDDDVCKRYSTWDEAVAGHKRMVKQVEAKATSTKQEGR